MNSATFFGEINALDSRAVWYSDEESSCDEDMVDAESPERHPHQFKAKDHEKVLDAIQFDYNSVISHNTPEFSYCLISLSTKAKYKNFRLNHDSNLRLIGHFGSLAKVFTWATGDQQESLWIMLDASHQYISSYMVTYFVEKLMKKINSLFTFHKDCLMIVISKQFSSSEHLEYLTNYPHGKTPFNGRQMSPPALISNHFEAAVFENSTVSFQPTTIVCLPDPRNCWFDNISNWEMVPEIIIRHRLQEDSLDQTLIFT